MTPFVENIVIGLLGGVVAGLVTGLYSGLVVSRFVRFSSLCTEALRAINSIDYMQEQHCVAVGRNDSAIVLFVGAELMYFGHKTAGLCVLAQQKLVASRIAEAKQGRVDADALSSSLNQARCNIRKARPSFRIFMPWGRV